MIETVAADVYDGREWDFDSFVCWGDAGKTAVGFSQLGEGEMGKEKGGAGTLCIQPVYHHVVGEFVDEFVNDTVDANGTADKL